MTTPNDSLPHLKALAALAEKATPGPWTTHNRNMDGVYEIVGANGYEVTGMLGYDHGGVRDEGDARFIAAANPQAILAILARLADAEAVVKAARKLASSLEAEYPRIIESDFPEFFRAMRDYDAAHSKEHA